MKSRTNLSMQLLAVCFFLITSVFENSNALAQSGYYNNTLRDKNDTASRRTRPAQPDTNRVVPQSNQGSQRSSRNHLIQRQASKDQLLNNQNSIQNQRQTQNQTQNQTQIQHPTSSHQSNGQLRQNEPIRQNSQPQNADASRLRNNYIKEANFQVPIPRPAPKSGPQFVPSVESESIDYGSVPNSFPPQTQSVLQNPQNVQQAQYAGGNDPAYAQREFHPNVSGSVLQVPQKTATERAVELLDRNQYLEAQVKKLMAENKALTTDLTQSKQLLARANGQIDQALVEITAVNQKLSGWGQMIERFKTEFDSYRNANSQSLKRMLDELDDILQSNMTQPGFVNQNSR